MEPCLFSLCIQFRISLLAHQSKKVHIHQDREIATALSFIACYCQDLLLCVRVGVCEVVNTLSKLVRYQQRERGSGLGSAGSQ